MELNEIQSHLKTTNVYVQRQIIRQNMEILSNKIYLARQQKETYLLRLDLKRRLENQKVIFNKINQKIKTQEQTCLTFLPIPLKTKEL